MLWAASCDTAVASAPEGKVHDDNADKLHAKAPNACDTAVASAPVGKAQEPCQEGAHLTKGLLNDRCLAGRGSKQTRETWETAETGDKESRKLFYA
eukprot:6248505-Lingulodinium_polyedra.AAC.2